MRVAAQTFQAASSGSFLVLLLLFAATTTTAYLPSSIQELRGQHYDGGVLQPRVRNTENEDDEVDCPAPLTLEASPDVLTRRAVLARSSHFAALATTTTAMVAAAAPSWAETLPSGESKPLAFQPFPVSTTTTTVAAASRGPGLPAAPLPPVDAPAILQRAGKKALGGGKAGAAAAVAQVSTLMWLRTTMNYQYANGGTLRGALATLYAEGGVARLYQGFPFALVQGPLSRFGDTAANAFVLALLEGVDLDLALKTVVSFDFPRAEKEIGEAEWSLLPNLCVCVCVCALRSALF